MSLVQHMVGPTGEPLSLLWGNRLRRLIPACRERQLHDEDMSGRYPIHAYQSDLSSPQPPVRCTKDMPENIMII